MLQETVMYHARALCGACKSSPATVPALITLCHSAFICESAVASSLPKLYRVH